MRVDSTTILGIALGLGSILAGQWLEGGRVNTILQLTAAIIVFGGTAGAVITQFPLPELRHAIRETQFILRSQNPPLEPLVTELVELARVSRREGLLAIEKAATEKTEPFLRHALLALIDGSDPAELRSALLGLIDQQEEVQQTGPKLFEAAGGYSPTVGILGAVLGLIHVMQNLSDPSRLGEGIAVAFVATVYGVGSANLLFLPFAEKLRMKIRSRTHRKELIVDAVVAIQDGLNPSLIERRLETYLEPAHRGG